MTAIVSNDACENDVTVATEATKDAPNDVALSEPQFAKQGTLEPSRAPELHAQDSISVRRTRKLTDLLFDEIAGKKLKCYEKWKLWLGLFICMTVIAVVAIAFAGYYAAKVNAYESKTDAVDAQSNLLYDIVHDYTANISDHVDETRKIFNTFDDNADGVWNSDEFYNHFVLGFSAESVFDGMDDDSDDILSWTEIVNSLAKHNLSQSYIPSVRAMYNITFNDSTDPLLNNYAANVYLDKFNIEQFGYITRSHFYEFRSNESFTIADTDGDNSISYDEFIQKIANDRTIQFMRAWNVESYLESINKSTVRNAYDILNPTAIGTTNMCPYNARSGSDGRRLIDEFDISMAIEMEGANQLVYDYNVGGCEAKLTCEFDHPNFWESSPERVECGYYFLIGVSECMVTAIAAYFDQDATLARCSMAMYNCMETYNFNDECVDVNCVCECSPSCKGHISGVFNPDRRRLACKGQNCACGSGCTCFSGDNQMLIKRDDATQNVLLKELRIGDYVHTKDGEWSKVWFIKEEEASEYEFLKLYFGENEYISMTNHHLLYVGDKTEQAMKRADEVTVGDIVFVMRNGTSFVEKEIVWIESTISSSGAYAPVTMEGSIVVNNVLSSRYVESPEKAQRLHDTAAVFRWISSYNTDLASFMTHCFYDSFFMKLR
eukprot:471265_1